MRHSAMHELDRLLPQPMRSFAKLFYAQLVFFSLGGVVFAAAELFDRTDPDHTHSQDLPYVAGFLGLLALLTILRDAIVNHRRWFRPTISAILVAIVVDALRQILVDPTPQTVLVGIAGGAFGAGFLRYLYLDVGAVRYFKAVRNAA